MNKIKILVMLNEKYKKYRKTGRKRLPLDNVEKF